MEKIKQFINRLFAAPSPQNELEAYIIARNPTSVGDVEYWTAQYDRLQQRKSCGMLGTHHNIIH